MIRKSTSLRPQNTGRKPGGQPGYPGQTLRQSANPDFCLPIPLDAYPDCGIDLSDQPVAEEEKRQVFDLPPLKLQVTEYQAVCKFCPTCRSRVTAKFPENVTAPAQYGPAIQAAMTYLNVRQVIPCARTAEIFVRTFLTTTLVLAASSKPWPNARRNSPRQWMKSALL